MFSYSHLLCLVGATAVLVSAGPCDLYADGKTPCIAAHSTTRSLYNAYSGPLYQVTRGSDGSSTDINALSAGSVADAEAQDSFCANTTCLISVIYDQSGKANHLTAAPPGGAASGPQPGGYDNTAAAVGAPVTVHGQKAYGVFISPGTGYRIDNGNSVPTGDQPQGIYAVLDGTHYNDACCFDYGNAETSNTDTGDGHMEAIYYGTCTFWGRGAGNGPWIMADLENGLFAGQSFAANEADPSLSNRFQTAIVKGEPGQWAIRGADAASGPLSTYYSGAYPSGYSPMHKEGSILLGIGGDNSNSAQGTFYEGVLTSGYPSDGIENAVHADIIAAKYETTSLVSGPPVTVGSSISFRATTPGYTDRYITHDGTAVSIQVPTSTAQMKAASFTVRTGLGFSGCVSFESNDTPGSYIRHSYFVLYVDPADGSKQFNEDATFCPQSGLVQGNSIRSWNYPTRYFRHFDTNGYLASNGGPEAFDNPYSFNNDVSFIVGPSLA